MEIRRSVARSVRGWLPEGRALADADWQLRHRYITAVLAAQVPAVLAYALATGQPFLHAAVDTTAPLVILILSLRARDRVVRTLAVAFGLITCSAVFVHLSGGLIEWHFHYFVMLALISLYREWRVYLLALGFVVLQHAIGGALDFDAVYNHGNGAWYWALIHGGFVLAASACHIAAWHFQEASDRRAEAYRVESITQAQRAADARSDLIATASHEFRTPITAVKLAATTLINHEKRLTDAERTELHRTIVDRATRLAEMLESMLVAADVEPAPGDTVTRLAPAVRSITEQLINGGETIRVDVPDYLAVRCTVPALHHVLERLVANTSRIADQAAPVRIVAHAVDSRVELEVAGPAGLLSIGSLEALAEPFHDPATDGRSADLGLGLYAVRRIVEVNGGGMSIRVDGADLVIKVWLPHAVAVAAPRKVRAEFSAVAVT